MIHVGDNHWPDPGSNVVVVLAGLAWRASASGGGAR
jgi:hypothetical protein